MDNFTAAQRSQDDDSEYDLVDVLNDDSGNTNFTIEDMHREGIKSWEKTYPVRAGWTKWKPREAFRELVQNWRDGIIKSFDMDERDFVVELDTGAGDTEIIYKAVHEEKCVGYIRFDGVTGTVDITNTNATLQPWNLDIGSSSKKGDKHQGGAHGEGIMIALLTLMRLPQNYSVRCVSGGFQWTFNFSDVGQLVMSLNRMSEKALQDYATENRERPVSMRADGDVRFIIGEKPNGRHDGGITIRRETMKRKEFEAWTKVALFLHREPRAPRTAAGQNTADARIPDLPFIPTYYGDLLIGEQLRGSMYLKGLLLGDSVSEPASGPECCFHETVDSMAQPPLLKSASVTNLPLRFGYNFFSGATNRERQSLANPGEEASAILRIWSLVLVSNPDMVGVLSDMINQKSPGYADVYWVGIRHDADMTRRLRDYLTRGKRKWYFYAEHMIKNPRLGSIIHGLGKEGVELTQRYWGALGFRTAEEEEQKQFALKLRVRVPQSSFALMLYRLLRACLNACPMTQGMEFEFVKAGRLSLNLCFFKKQNAFLIHERWLSVDVVVRELGLADNTTQDSVLIYAANKLFEDALEQLPLEAFLPKESPEEKAAEWFRSQEVRRSMKRLHDYLRMLPAVTAMTGVGTMRVRWTVDPLAPVDNKVEIQCHRASCVSAIRDKLLTAKDACADNMGCIPKADIDGQQRSTAYNSATPRAPLCRVCRVDQGKGEHYESNLEDGEKYFFVLVPLDDPGAIVALSDTTMVSHHLQNYHMQLMLLEQQNKKRLMMARQENETAGKGRYGVPGVAAGTTVPLFCLANPEALVVRAVPSRQGSDQGMAPSGVDLAPGRSNTELVSSRIGLASEVGQTDMDIDTSSADTVGNERFNKAQAAALSKTFALGDQLKNLNFFYEVGADGWYEAKSLGNARAVIGIIGKDKLTPETRKRRKEGDGMV